MKSTEPTGEPKSYEQAEYGLQDLSLYKSLFNRDVAQLDEEARAARHIPLYDIDAKMLLLPIEGIAELKARDKLSRESEERFKRIFETANDGMVLIGKKQAR